LKDAKSPSPLLGIADGPRHVNLKDKPDETQMRLPNTVLASKCRTDLDLVDVWYYKHACRPFSCKVFVLGIDEGVCRPRRGKQLAGIVHLDAELRRVQVFFVFRLCENQNQDPADKDIGEKR
jgi:hypothetical protein